MLASDRLFSEHWARRFSRLWKSRAHVSTCSVGTYPYAARSTHSRPHSVQHTYTYHRHYDIQGKGNAKHCQCQRHTRCRIEQTRWDWPSYHVRDPALAPPGRHRLPGKAFSSANNTGYVIFASYKSCPRRRTEEDNRSTQQNEPRWWSVGRKSGKRGETKKLRGAKQQPEKSFDIEPRNQEPRVSRAG